MDDDDLAGKAQQLLDAIEGFLGNKELVEQLSSVDLIKLRKHRANITKLLAAYRALHYMKKPKGKHPAKIPIGSLEGMLLGVALGGTTLSPILGQLVTNVLPRVVTAVGPRVAIGAGARVATSIALLEILWPFAVPVIIDQLILGGGSPRAEIAGKLVDAVAAFGREILALDAITTVLMITAAEIAELATEEILDLLIAATKVLRLATVALLLEELLRRFPGCVHEINTLSALANLLHRMRANPSHFGSGIFKKLREVRQQLVEAGKALEDCIRGSFGPSET